MQALVEETEQVMKDRDEETKKYHEAETERMMKVIDELRNDRLRSYRKDQDEWFEALNQQKEREVEFIKAHYEREIERLRELLKKEVTQHEEDQKQNNINERSKKAGRTRPNSFSKFAGWVDSATT